MSSEKKNQGQRKKPRRTQKPSAAPTRQEDSPSLPTNDNNSSHAAEKTPNRTRNSQPGPDPSPTASECGPANPRIEGIDDDDYLIPMKEVMRRTGLSRGTVEYLMKTADFPLPIQMGRRCVRWWSSEVDHWILTRKRAKGHLGKRHSKLQTEGDTIEDGKESEETGEESE